MGDTGKEILGNDSVGVRDGNGEGHYVVEVVGLDVAAPVEVAAENEVKVGVVGRKLHEEVIEPIEGGVASDNGEYVDVDGKLFSGVDESGEYVIPEAFDDQLFAAFLVSIGDVLVFLPYRFECLNVVSTFLFISEVGKVGSEVIGLNYLPGKLF